MCLMQPVDMLINHLDFFRFWMFLGWLVEMILLIREFEAGKKTVN